MSTQKLSSVSMDFVVPGVIGGGLFLFAVIVLRQAVVLPAALAIVSGVFGFGIGMATLPFLYWTGLGYMPPSSTPKFQQSPQFGDALAVHVAAAFYYSYLTGFLAITLGVELDRFISSFQNPTVVGVFSGLVVGILFAVSQTWMTALRDYRISPRTILLWVFYGSLLTITGISWEVILSIRSGP